MEYQLESTELHNCWDSVPSCTVAGQRLVSNFDFHSCLLKATPAFGFMNLKDLTLLVSEGLLGNNPETDPRVR